MIRVASLLAIALAACPAEQTGLAIGRYVIDVPETWQARRDDSDEGHLALVLAPQPATLLCRVEVIEEAGRLGAEQADVFLTLARQDFPGSQERQKELRTKIGRLHGFSIQDALESRRGGDAGRRERSEVQVYAAVFGIDLVAAVAGGWSRDRAGRRERDACLRAIRSIRRRASD